MHYINGIPHGSRLEWYKNGQKKLEYFYSYGTKNGTCLPDIQMVLKNTCIHIKTDEKTLPSRDGAVSLVPSVHGTKIIP